MNFMADGILSAVVFDRPPGKPTRVVGRQPPLSVIKKKPGYSPGYLSNAQEIPASLNLLLLPVKINQPVEYRIIAL
jgi:hypothetical protein